MGNRGSQLIQLANSYVEQEAFVDPNQTSGVKIYFKNSRPDYVLTDKDFNFQDMGLSPESLAVIEKRAARLPVDCLPGSPQYSNKTLDVIKVKFLTGSMNLNDLVMMRRYRGKENMTENETRYLMNYLLNFGNQMQNIREYHYLLNMTNVFVTTEGLKVQNPFIYRSYITDSMKILEDMSWLQAADESKVKITSDNKNYQNKLRRNLRQVGLIVLLAGLHRHDTHLIDEQGDLDKELVEVVIQDFKAIFSQELGLSVQNLIQLGKNEQNLPLFSTFNTVDPGNNSSFIVSNTECTQNFVMKLNGPGGFFFRDYDIPPHPEDSVNPIDDVRTNFFMHPDVKVKVPENPQTQAEWSIVEQSIRKQRPNPYIRRSPSPLVRPQNQEESKANQSSFYNDPKLGDTEQKYPTNVPPKTPIFNDLARDPRAPSPPKEYRRPEYPGLNRPPTTDSGYHKPKSSTNNEYETPVRGSGHHLPGQTNNLLSGYIYPGTSGPNIPQPSPINQQSKPEVFPKTPDSKRPKPSPEIFADDKENVKDELIDPIQARKIQENDAIYGKVEQIFRERRPTLNEMAKQEQSMREGGNISVLNNQSKLNTSIQNNLYSEPYKKDPSNFQFPIMDTRSKRPAGPSLEPISESPKPYLNSNQGLGLRPKPVPGNPINDYSTKSPVYQLENSARGPQTVYTMTQNGSRAIGPEAFVPPLDKLSRYSQSKYNPLTGSNLHMADNRKSYIDSVKYPKPTLGPVIQSLGTPGNSATQTIVNPVRIPQAGGFLEPAIPVNFFQGQRESTPFSYSPSNNSKRKASASKSQERQNPLDQLNMGGSKPASSTLRKPAKDIYSPDEGKTSAPWNWNAVVRLQLLDS